MGERLQNLEIEAVLGKGGTATVYKARQLSTGREVAVKVLDGAFAQTQEDVRRFLDEAKMCAHFQHRNIVRVYDSGVVDQTYYFVMELIRGYTFASYLQRKKLVAVEDCVIILEAVTAALSYAWEQFKVVHCDLKPDNLVVDADGTIKVMDLGISRSLLSVAKKEDSTGEIMGTPAYMSPDQIYDYADLDCRADIYSLGATLYHLLTGQMLFPGKTDQQVVDAHIGQCFARDPRVIVPEIPRALALMLNRMLAKDRDLRYPDWSTLAADIARLYSGEPLLATPLKPGESSVNFVSEW